MTRPPEFEELFDADEAGTDAERLRRVHELLVQAGPPPELGPALQAPPAQLDLARRRRHPRRSLSFHAGALRYVAAAAAIALAFLVGRGTSSGGGDEFAAARTIPLAATHAAPLATGRLEIGRSSSHGNWPMRLTAESLPALAEQDYYAVFITRRGKVVGLCGYFHVQHGRAEAYLNAPYPPVGAGWIVTRQHPGDRTLGPVVLKTIA